MDNNAIERALNERFLLQREYLGQEKTVNNIVPLVTVTVTTYQHADYIKECLDGILMQKTNFPFEVIVGEDGSVDGTQEICKEYAERYPDKIRLFIRDRKLSQYVDENGKVTRFNGIWNRMSARGKYIAWCEGDDYWIDPSKLQKQVDFLESHPECSMCFHNAKVISYNGKGEDLYNHLREKEYTANDIVRKWSVPTASVVYRRKYLSDMPSDKRFMYTDIVLFLTMASKGRVYCMGEKMSVYRRLASGMLYVTQRRSHALYRKTINHYKALAKHFPQIKYMAYYIVAKTYLFHLRFTLIKLFNENYS